MSDQPPAPPDDQPDQPTDPPPLETVVIEERDMTVTEPDEPDGPAPA